MKSTENTREINQNQDIKGKQEKEEMKDHQMKGSKENQRIWRQMKGYLQSES